jgi:hypothetical protein
MLDVEDPTFPRQSGEVVSLTSRRGRFLALIFVKGSVNPRALIRPNELSTLKNPINRSRICVR